MPDGAQPVETLHATCVAVGPLGCLIVGASGRGKSALALRLIALGAELVADDRTMVRPYPGGDGVLATAPQNIRGRIEARGVGILRVPAREAVTVSLVVDLDQQEAKRLPEPHGYRVAGLHLPCLHDPEMAHFPAAIMAYLTHMLHADAE